MRSADVADACSGSDTWPDPDLFGCSEYVQLQRTHPAVLRDRRLSRNQALAWAFKGQWETIFMLPLLQRGWPHVAPEEPGQARACAISKKRAKSTKAHALVLRRRLARKRIGGFHSRDRNDPRDGVAR